MAKISITEVQGRTCAEALEIAARFAEKNGEIKVCEDCRDLAKRIRHKLEYVDDKMRSSGRRR